FLRKKAVDWYNLSSEGLTLTLQPTTLSEYQNPSFIARRLQHHQAVMQTEMIFSPLTGKETAGLAIFQGEKNYYFIGLTKREKDTYVCLYKSDEQGSIPIASTRVSFNKKIQFQIKVDKDQCYFYYATKIDDWQLLGSNQDARHLSTQTAGG